VLRVHLLVRRGHDAVEAIASVVGDKTLQVASLLVFGGLGALLFLQRKVTGDLLAYAVVGLGLMAFAVYGALILRGDAQQQREGAETIGKLMLFVAGPLGAVLLLLGVVMLVQDLSKANNND